MLQGRVSDGNAYALGGISGHAGLFSTMPDLHRFMHRYMFAPQDPHDLFALNRTTSEPRAGGGGEAMRR